MSAMNAREERRWQQIRQIRQRRQQLAAARASQAAAEWRHRQGEALRKEAASVILFAAEAATQSALDAIQCLGGNGYTNDYDAARLLRDAKLYEIGAGTSEIRRMLIGRELLR